MQFFQRKGFRRSILPMNNETVAHFPGSMGNTVDGRCDLFRSHNGEILTDQSINQGTLARLDPAEDRDAERPARRISYLAQSLRFSIQRRILLKKRSDLQQEGLKTFLNASAIPSSFHDTSEKGNYVRGRLRSICCRQDSQPANSERFFISC